MPTKTDEQQFIRALERKFRAVEVEPPASSSSSSSSSSSTSSEAEKCALCRRTDKLGTSRDSFGRPYCRESEWSQCNRIAQGRLGASAGKGTSTNALHGHLRADGKCRDCHEPVKWVKTQKGKKMPVDVKPAPPRVAAFELVGAIDTLAFYIGEKRRERIDGDVYESHYQTCSSREPD